MNDAGRSQTDWRGVGAYIGLAFGLAWALTGIALSRGARFQTLTIRTTVLLAGVMLTPALSAFIARKWITREGFASSGLRFGSWRPYLAVWIGVPLVVIGIYALTVLLGLGQFDPKLQQLFARIQEAAARLNTPVPDLPGPLVLGAAIFAQALTFGVVVTSLFTFGEEFGWTGYLLVKLLPLGRWRAAVIYGVVWGLWHAPIIARGFNYPGYPVIGVMMMCALTTAFALTQTALWLRSRSVLLTSFFHASVNSQGLGIIPMAVAGVSPVMGGVTGVVGIAVFAAIGAWLLARTPDPHAGTASKASPLDSA
jgi:hypothetical protein